MHKSKFNKKKCATCKYHRNIHSGKVSNIMCNYSAVCEETCLHLVHGQVEDRRGSEYNACKLYMEGEPSIKEYKMVY